MDITKLSKANGPRNGPFAQKQHKLKEYYIIKSFIFKPFFINYILKYEILCIKKGYFVSLLLYKLK